MPPLLHLIEDHQPASFPFRRHTNRDSVELQHFFLAGEMKGARLASIVRDGHGGRRLDDRQMRGGAAHFGRQLPYPLGVIGALALCREGARASIAAGSPPAPSTPRGGLRTGPAGRQPVRAESDLTRELTQLTIERPSTCEIRRVLLGPY